MEMTENEKTYSDVARGYLKNVLEYELKQETLEREIEWWKNKAEGCGSVMPQDKIQTSPQPDKMENAIIKIQEVRDRIGAQLDECVTFRRNAYLTVEKLENAVKRQILYMRYFDFVTKIDKQGEITRTRRMSEVAEMLGYNEEYTRRLHRSALIELGEILVKSSK